MVYCNVMNYFIANVFRDWKWWARIGVAFLGALNLMDILSTMFAYPGYFGLWIVRLTMIGSIGGLVAYYIFQSRRDKKNSRIEALLPAFIAERYVYFEKMIAADPKFQTLCYECRHFDSGRRACNLRLHDRKIKIKLDPADAFSYCLYWNLGDHPILILTDRIASQGTEQSAHPE